MVISVYAALLGLMAVALSIHVVRGRRAFGVGIGDANHIEMRRRIRAQSNLLEYTPLFLILLGLAEYQGLAIWALHLFGVVFVAGRIMHAYSLLKAEIYNEHALVKNPIWRIRGMMCTFGAIGMLSVILLALSAGI